MSGGRIIYIIGFMGSGKSTMGRRLASLMGWQFLDLDDRIEEITGKTIARIFSEDGEEEFRKTESETLKSLATATNTIISTGGGTPCHSGNMDHMLETGITVYLKMTPGQLASRLVGSSGERPLLKNIPDEELLSFIGKKLSDREQWYSRAGIIVDGLNPDPGLLVSMIEAES
ncbi:MAG: shikimate kinase [Bacteroidales bacterium]|jgi:shikimate kinase|nr:shikimate kinase [Bacteroidales bacterium]